MTITIKANKRSNEKTAVLRAAELMPAVYYGAGTESTPISISLKDFIKVWKQAGETTTVTLDIDGTKVTTLIHDMQHDPITGTPTHVDFLVIDMKKEIEVAIPLEFVGTAEAETANVGVLSKILYEVEVRALPANLPHSIEIDVSGLATLEDQIHVSDIKLPSGVEMITDGEDVVALITAFVEEKEETPVMDLSAIEVEKKGKKDEEVAAE